MVTPFVCSSINKDNEYCKYDEGTSKCASASNDTGLACDTFGLNRITCAEKTTGRCGFFSD